MIFSRSRDRSSDTGLPITSLIDVVFLLLIYFIVTSRFTEPESRLSSALQVERQGPGRQSDFAPQVVRVELVGGTPAFRVGERIVRSQPDLQDLLAGLRREHGVFVRVSGAVPVSAAAAALQAAKDAGFSRISYVPAP